MDYTMGKGVTKKKDLRENQVQNCVFVECQTPKVL